jgi:polysaccharide biosynthesis protein PelF
MDVAMIGEGCYPHQFGGVSVWCDQLIRRMPHHKYRVVALVATGDEPVRWTLPANVLSVEAIPLWAYQPATRSRRRARATSSLVRDLIEILLSPPDESQLRFAEVLRELFEVAQRGHLAELFYANEAIATLSERWRDHWPDVEQAPPSLHDAVAAMQLLEHSLRPLAHPPVQAEVSHAVTNGLGALPALAAKWRHGMPILVTEHGLYMREQYLHHRAGPYRWPVKALHMAFLRRMCTLGYHEAETIAPGNIFNRRWEEKLGAAPSRIQTVYNGVDPAEFPAVEGEPAVPTISWAGRIDPFKDLETLLRAVVLVRRQLPTVKLRIFGSPPRGREAYLKRCQSLAAELKIDDAVTFEGRIANIRDAYAAGHVVVLCSITEGFPYTLIEAMICGRACVATDVGGVSEAVADTGLVVPPRNPDAIATACLELLRNERRRRSLAASARRRALEFFTVDRTVSAYGELYTRTAARNPAADGHSTDVVALEAAG